VESAIYSAVLLGIIHVEAYSMSYEIIFKHVVSLIGDGSGEGGNVVDANIAVPRTWNSRRDHSLL
jgi:hypothetical protein